MFFTTAATATAGKKWSSTSCFPEQMRDVFERVEAFCEQDGRCREEVWKLDEGGDEAVRAEQWLPSARQRNPELAIAGERVLNDDQGD